MQTRFASMLTPDSVINALGGTKAVASALSLNKSSVSCWRTRGIPAAHFAPLARLASEKGVSDVTLEALSGMTAVKATVDEARA